MRTNEPSEFAGSGLDRDAARRKNAASFWGGDARIVPFWKGRPLVTRGEATRLSPKTTGHWLLEGFAAQTVYLGHAEGRCWFAADVSGWTPPNAPFPDDGPGRVAADLPLPDDATAVFADLRGLAPHLSPLHGEIAATGRGLLEWHQSHRFCGHCGAPTESREGGWQRLCPSCGRPHFPRTDPVVIMLVTHGNTLLLGRSPGWPEGFFSLLAGFVEPGETVENAVRREVLEETGIATGAVRLHSSQPWPFPASLMLGCTAKALGTDITIDPDEIDDALWIRREELLDVFAGQHPTIRTPGAGTIAHALMSLWLADRFD